MPDDLLPLATGVHSPSNRPSQQARRNQVENISIIVLILGGVCECVWIPAQLILMVSVAGAELIHRCAVQSTAALMETLEYINTWSSWPGCRNSWLALCARTPKHEHAVRPKQRWTNQVLVAMRRPC